MPITKAVTVRTTLVLVVIVALGFGAWRMLLAPQTQKAADGAGASADALVDTVSRAYFTGAEASLEVQRSTTGSYAGARLEPPMTLVRADATSYCIQLDRPPAQAHENGPGGVPAAGPCA
jgi:hypothetical protein